MRVSGKVYRISVLLCAVVDLGLAFFNDPSLHIPANQLDARQYPQADAQAANFHSLTADFRRTKVRPFIINDKSTESGQILSHRRQMRIEVTQPDARTILRDGDDLHLQPENSPRRGIRFGREDPVVDQFLLLGFRDFRKFVEESTRSRSRRRNAWTTAKLFCWSCCRSDEVRKQLSKIQLWLDDSTWLPVQQQFFETGSGNLFIIRYRNINRNMRVPDDEFEPHWPHSTTRVQPQA